MVRVVLLDAGLIMGLEYKELVIAWWWWWLDDGLTAWGLTVGIRCRH